MSKGLLQSLFNGYKNLSVKGLSLAVYPSLLGELPKLNDNAITFYVLDEYSRANSLLLEQQIQALGLPSALKPIKTSPSNQSALNTSLAQQPSTPNHNAAAQSHCLDESSAMIFLKHRHAKTALSPRLGRLIEACLTNPDLNIELVPVTILWGRSPDKEDSLFKLLFADEWRVPSISKQLFNIGVMGRDTFLQFYQPKSLQQLIKDAQDNTNHSKTFQNTTTQNTTPHTATINAQKPNSQDLTASIQKRLQGYLFKQRASILGPDLSGRRKITSNILTATSVQEAMIDKAQQTGKPITAIKKETQSYIDEIASDYSYSVVRAFEQFLGWLWTQLYDGVQVHHFERVRTLAPDYQVVYVPCHRSHMDYLLLSYIIHNHGLRVPHVAAGANLNIPILGEILRSAGAFFLRRSFRDNPLYGTVLKEYLHNLMQLSSPIEYFIEGGRSRSGRLLTPKMGMLAMTVASHLKAPTKPVVFIPTYISYERIMEGATYVGELKGKPKQSENLLGLIKTARKIERIYGQVNLSFGTPLFLDDFLDKFALDDKFHPIVDHHAPSTNANNTSIDNIGIDSTDIGSTSIDNNTDPQTLPQFKPLIEQLGLTIMQHINNAVVVNPISLVALVLLSAPKTIFDERQFLTQLTFYQHIAQALSYDNDTQITTMPSEQMIDYALSLKLITRTTHPLGNVIGIADKQAPMLSYLRNNIVHVFILPSLIAALVKRNGRININSLHTIVVLLYPFLQAELFLKYNPDDISTVIDDILAVLIDTGTLIDLGDEMIASPDGNSEAYQQLIILASPAEQSLERYFMTLTLLAEQGSGKLTLTQVVELAYLIGGRLSALHGDDLPDLFDKALFTSFLNALLRTKYLRYDDNNLLCFDERITTVAHYAKLVLSPDVMTMLHKATSLDPSSLDNLQNKKGLFK